MLCGIFLIQSYLIDMNQGQREIVQNILNLLNIPPEKMISARVFRLLSFDYKSQGEPGEG